MRLVRLFLLAVLANIAAPASALAVLSNVDQATDICPADTDPCVVDQQVKTVDGATLDFGLRHVSIVPGGFFDNGSGTVTVVCGGLDASVNSAVAINARGPNGGAIDGGSFLLQTLRACTADVSRTCVGEDECQVGPCDAGFCSGDLGRSCGGDEDCDLGLCAIGTGDVDINGAVRFDGREAGTFAVRAAGDIVLHQPIDGSSSGTASDGGTLELVSSHASVGVLGAVQLSGGGQAQGGLLTISAPELVNVTTSVDVSGGDFDGGIVAVEAGGDVTWAGDILADATSGEGAGGDVTLHAGGDLTLGAFSVSANGGQSHAESFGGDGGFVEMIAGGNLALGGTTVTAEAAIPNGAGDTIRLSAGHDLSVGASLSVRAPGTAGAGGTIEGTAGGALSVVAGSAFDVRGGSAGGGGVLLDAVGTLSFDGSVNAVASSGGTGDTVSLQSSGQIVLGGQIHMGGSTSNDVDGGVELRACSADLLSTAAITNTGARGVNTVRAPNGIIVRAGAHMSAAKPLGQNRFEIAQASPQPVVSGVVDPAAVVVVDNALAGCAACGNGQVEQGETCDDDNQTPGDGCSTDCQDERCIAQSLDYPAAPLCNDDLACTKDTCDTVAGECTHAESCDDGFACTTDSCGPGGACIHDPDNSLCDDANPCTADVCLDSSGCVGFAEDGDCDDARACTANDACVSGRCRGVKTCDAGNYCSLEGNCVTGSTTTTTTVSTTTTSILTTTTLPSNCGNGALEGGEQCDDGDTLWDVGQACNASCQWLACGDPDESGNTKASDSLFALRAAVKAATCDLCLCDVDASGSITASDALALLRAAVGLPANMACPNC